MEKRSRGRPKYIPNDNDLKKVKILIIAGLQKRKIAQVLGVSEPILNLHYKKEMDSAKEEANGAVVANLFRLATRGDNPTPAIFWCKTQLRWKEVHGVEVAGKDGKPLQPIIEIVKQDSGRRDNKD